MLEWTQTLWMQPQVCIHKFSIKTQNFGNLMNCCQLPPKSENQVAVHSMKQFVSSGKQIYVKFGFVKLNCFC